MTDPADVRNAIKQFEVYHDITSEAKVKMAREWLAMRDALTTMATSDDEWYVYKTSMRDYARKTLGMEVGEDD